MNTNDILPYKETFADVQILSWHEDYRRLIDVRCKFCLIRREDTGMKMWIVALSEKYTTKL